MGYKRHRSALRKRYGRSWSNESAITIPREDGFVDVVLVDARGELVKSLARKVPYSLAKAIIRRRHG
jgi:hypothetical protein